MEQEESGEAPAKRISPTRNNALTAAKRHRARADARFISSSEVLSPTAAIAMTRHARAISLSAAPIGFGMRPRLAIATSATNATEERRQQRIAATRPVVQQPVAYDERQHHDDRQQHRHAQHLGEDRRVADLGGDAIARADDLRDVVDRAAEEYACLPRIEAEPADDRRVENHRERR